MESKSWYKSKAVWAGIVAVLVASYNSAAGNFHLPAIPDFVFALLGAMGIYSRATTTTTLTK